MPSETDDPQRASHSGLRALGSVPPPPAAPSVQLPRSSRYVAGTLIAEKYRLSRKLGEGGMGEVWLAHNETLEIDVAIKVIRGEVATPEMTERLLNEARAAARIGHPSIVRINDFGKTNVGDPFIVMELLEGEDLAGALTARGRLSAQKAVRTLLPIAHALAAAHTKGIVHRDLKPENIFLARGDDGQMLPKLVDFGVAKLEKPHSGRLTQSGALLGSPLYMSPEQARGDDVDHRADVWALGVVLYEATTGRPPFEGKNYNAVLYSIIANPPTPIHDLGVGDADLWSIIERALQKDPDRRWYSMRDFGEALARWLEDRDIHDDIAGASLQATWLSWKRGEDALAGGASTRPPADTTPGSLPPAPVIADRQLSRERVVTVRKPRRRPALLAGVAALAFAIALIAVAMSRNGEHVEQANVSAAPGEVGAPVEATAAKEDPAHERAIQDALVAAAVPQQEGSGNPATAPPAARPARTAVATPQSKLRSGGIHIADPYATPQPRVTKAKPKLKDPF